MTIDLHVVRPDETPVADDTIHLSTVEEILEEVVPTLLALNGQPFETTPAGQAEMNRTLLHLADQFELASSLVKNVYWQTKGRASYDL